MGPLQSNCQAGCSNGWESQVWLLCLQEMDRVDKQLNLIAERIGEIKDLNTRHELTVKRNSEARRALLHQHASLKHVVGLSFSLCRVAY